MFDDAPKLTVGFLNFDFLAVCTGRLAAKMGLDAWASAVNPLADGDAAASTLVCAAAAGWRPPPEVAGTTDSGGKPPGGGELAELRLFREGPDFAIAGTTGPARTASEDACWAVEDGLATVSDDDLGAVEDGPAAAAIGAGRATGTGATVVSAPAPATGGAFADSTKVSGDPSVPVGLEVTPPSATLSMS